MRIFTLFINYVYAENCFMYFNKYHLNFFFIYWICESEKLIERSECLLGIELYNYMWGNPKSVKLSQKLQLAAAICNEIWQQ